MKDIYFAQPALRISKQICAEKDVKCFPGDNCSVCDPADGGRDRKRRHLPQAQGENLRSMCLKSSLWDLVNVGIKHLEMVHSRHKITLT